MGQATGGAVFPGASPGRRREDPGKATGDEEDAVERTTGKHAARLDEQLAHEEGALVRGAPDEGRTEPRRAEAPAPDEPGMGARPEVEEPAAVAPPLSDLDRLQALAATFPPTSFPARPDRLADAARAAYADESLVEAVAALPDRTYESVTDLDAALSDQGAEEASGAPEVADDLSEAQGGEGDDRLG